MDRIQQILVVERLGKEIDGADLDGLDSQIPVPMGGYEKDGDLRPRPGEFPVKVQPAHVGHSDIEHQAGGPGFGQGGQEFVGGGEGLDPIILRSKKPREQHSPTAPS